MRLDIENKILFPFIILLMLSIIILGIVSYWNGYQLLLKNETKNISQNLEETIYYIENIQGKIDRDILTEDKGKSIVLDYYEASRKNNLIIFDREGILLTTFSGGGEWYEKIKDEDIKGNKKEKSIGNYTLNYTSYDKWDWIIGYRLNKGIFSYEVLEKQKYMVLVAIISLLFSMQATIFIAHNLSKPIKLLAEVCDKIAQGSFQEKINIKRKDEIGVLANAFNNMVYRLQINTSKLLNITRLNEDILRNISVGIITTDQNGEISSINEAAKGFLSIEETSGIKEQVKDQLLEQLKKTLETNRNINNVYIFDNVKEGNKIYLDATTSLLRAGDDPPSGAICNFNDISERKKIESNMETLDRLTSIGKLAAGIAHEIRNPLAGMKTSIQVLKNRLCNEDDLSNKRLYNGVLSEIDRINRLITRILNFAKPRNPKYEKVDLLDALNRMLDLFNKSPEEKEIKINIINNSSNTLIYVDKDQLEQILLNIIQNAFAAMDNDNGILTISIQNIYEGNKAYIGIGFHDNGCGINQENLDKIYDPFYTTKPQGTGLGLSVVYELVKGNNGKIEVISNVGIGTKFIIKFPIYGGKRDEKKRIIIVDDEETIRISMEEGLKDLGYLVKTAPNSTKALKEIREFKPLAIFLDMRLASENGLDILPKIKELDSDIEVVIMTAYGDIQTAVKSIKAGAFDYINKPFDLQEINIIIERIITKIDLQNKICLLENAKKTYVNNIYGDHPSIKKILDRIEILADNDVTVLVTGETGTGKELVSSAIHENSPRGNAPMLKINCSTIPEQLIESELFGFEKNAFTGANKRKKGLLEIADGSTVFLDEIGEFPLSVQPKLLRFIEEKKFKRVGGLVDISVDVRIIAATNKNLEKAIKNKEFREDLYYRLNVVPVLLPPLRERGKDILLLANHFLEIFNRKFHKNINGFTEKAENALMNYKWKGNIRELKNVIERIVILGEGSYIDLGDLPLEKYKRTEDVDVELRESMEEVSIQDFNPDFSLEEEVKKLEVKYISLALELCNNNYSNASELLGISRFALKRRVEKYF